MTKFFAFNFKKAKLLILLIKNKTLFRYPSKYIKYMEHKDHLHPLPEKEKSKFHAQEAAGGYNLLSKYLFGMFVLITIADLLVTTFVPVPLANRELTIHPYIPFIGPVIAGVLFSLTYLKSLQQNNQKILHLKIFLGSAACVAFGIHSILMQYLYVKNALVSHNPEEWVRAYISLSTSAILGFLFAFITPFWYLKAFVPVCYFIGILAAYAHVKAPESTWMIIRNIIYIIYMVFIIAFRTNFRWKQFQKTVESDAWKKVHNNLLDRNPTPTAVLDITGKIIYSNDEFKRQTDNNAVNFFRKVTNLKKRITNHSMASIEDIHSLKNIIVQEDPSFDSPISKRRSTATFGLYRNLEALLEYYKNLLRNNEIHGEDQLVFDGKIQKTRGINNTFTSFEVTIWPLIEYQKIILILKNTTARDLLVSLENTSGYKDKLLASISHELKTPLNGNLAFLQVAISDQTIPTAVKEKLLLPAFRSGKLLFHLISDFLDYSQLQNQKMLMCYEFRPIRETLTYCYQLLEHVFQTKGLKFSLHVSDNVPHMFTTDHDRLAQVILNLLSNALKFTMKGKVSIEAEKITHNVLEIKVRDTGMGMKEEDQHELFEERLFEEDPLICKRQKHSQGAGLGLKIAHRLAKKLGSKESGIQVHSIYGEGSEFYFRINNKSGGPDAQLANFISDTDIMKIKEPAPGTTVVQTDPSLPNIPTEYEGIRTSLTEIPYSFSKTPYKKNPSSFNLSHVELEPIIEINRKKLLIVDDEPFNILALKSLLGYTNVIIESANNGQEAIEKIQSQANTSSPYLLILMDCQMPVMDGYEATASLMKKMRNKEIPTIPIVGCTAFNAKEKLERCLRVGMKEVVVKPVMRERIMEIAKKYLD